MPRRSRVFPAHRLHGQPDDRGRSLDGLEDHRPVGLGQGVAGTGLAQPYHGHDVAGVYFLDLFALVGVHLEQPADTFLVALVYVEDLLSGGQVPGVKPDKGQVAHVGVVDDLKGQRGQRIVVHGRAGDFVLAVHSDHGSHFQRGGQIVHHRVQKRLNPLVLKGGATNHRNRAQRNASGPEASFDLGLGEFFAGKIAVGQLFVVLGGRLDQLYVQGLGLVQILGRDLPHGHLGTRLAVEVESLHLDEIDHALEILCLPHGKLQQDRPGAQAFLDHSDRTPQVGPDPVHLIDEGDPRNPVLVGLTPDRFGLWFHSAHSTKNSYLRRQARARTAPPQR